MSICATTRGDTPRDPEAMMGGFNLSTDAVAQAMRVRRPEPSTPAEVLAEREDYHRRRKLQRSREAGRSRG